MATISGPPECCSRARKMVQDIVAEVYVYAARHSALVYNLVFLHDNYSIGYHTHSRPIREIFVLAIVKIRL